MAEEMMQKQMNELTALCSRFNDAITGIGKNQQEISEHIKGQDSKIEEIALKININPDTIQNNSTKNPATIKENNPSPGFAGAIKTVQKWYDGNPDEWFPFKKKIKNLTWALNLSKVESIKLIKLALAGPAIYVSDNIDQDIYINDMNGDGGMDGYLLALENLFVGRAASDISRTKFAMAFQLKNETVPLYASRIVALFNNAFPEEENPNKHLLVLDKFISGLNDEAQKKFVLQQKGKDDHLSKIMDIALKYESVNTILNKKSNTMNNASFASNHATTTNNINYINYRRPSNANSFHRRPFRQNFNSNSNLHNYRRPSNFNSNNNYRFEANSFRRGNNAPRFFNSNKSFAPRSNNVSRNDSYQRNTNHQQRYNPKTSRNNNSSSYEPQRTNFNKTDNQANINNMQNNEED